MTHGFDKDYWEQHWHQARRSGPTPNPYLAREVGDLAPGTALDAGCGAGAEARWLAARGWQVTAADISAEALARAAAEPAAAEPAAGAVRWVEADLTVWDPGTRYDLVTTHYAHPAMPHLAFYDRIAGWVAPGGTLLIVGHRPGQHHHPAEATVTLADITAGLDAGEWIVTAAEHTRPVPGHADPLRDVVVRATRVIA
jgi:SAM-dependent methyltransferase